MSNSPVRRPATYEDIVALPPHVTGEVIDGELHVSPHPAIPQAYSRSTLGMDLGSAFMRGRGGPGTWWVLQQPEIHFGKDVVVPDLAGWRKSRLPAIPPEPFFSLTSDWVCEVLSPSTASFDRVKKMRVFAREGVGPAWLVDPAARTLEAYELSAGRWTPLGAHERDEVVRAAPFGDIEIPLADLWVGEATGSSQDPSPAAP